jgi:SSS family solute:Na+ symporter
VRELVPVGFTGLVLAALFGAIQSTVNSVLNSTSTIFTIDIYQRMIRRDADDAEIVRVGIVTTIVVLAISIVLALFIDRFKGQVFLYIQTLYAFFAAPFAAVFILGLLWRRINSIAATVAVFAGFTFAVLQKVYIALFEIAARPNEHTDQWYESLASVLFAWFPQPPSWLYPYGNQASLTWIFCALLCIGISLATKPQEHLDKSVVCDWSNLKLGEGLGTRWYNHVFLWWIIWVACIFVMIYLFTGVLS